MVYKLLILVVVIFSLAVTFKKNKLFYFDNKSYEVVNPHFQKICRIYLILFLPIITLLLILVDIRFIGVLVLTLILVENAFKKMGLKKEYIKKIHSS